ncbi:MAG: SPOR domain-containing protein [Cyclobacteriaceae bacterium]
MRYSGIIILSLLVACKAAPPAATIPTYEEDLSVHRPQLDSSLVISDVPATEAFVPLKGHIRAELDSIVKISVALNKEEKLVEGFVIQVYNGNSRDRANEVWRQMDSNFPELVAKVSYHQPNFRVKAGRFTDRLTAHRVFREVKEEFPKALLVPERLAMNYE